MPDGSAGYEGGGKGMFYNQHWVKIVKACLYPPPKWAHPWGQSPSRLQVHHFYSGGLQGNVQIKQCHEQPSNCHRQWGKLFIYWSYILVYFVNRKWKVPQIKRFSFQIPSKAVQTILCSIAGNSTLAQKAVPPSVVHHSHNPLFNLSCYAMYLKSPFVIWRSQYFWVLRITQVI